MSLTKSLLGKAGMGALAATMLTPMFNQYARKPLTKAVGARGATDLSDALTGAEAGMFLGPEGMLGGALIGGVYGERGHILQDAKDVGHLGNQIGHGAKSIWDDVFGGGGSSSSNTSKSAQRPVIHNYVTVQIDGKEVAKAVQKQTKQQAARY
jgi:hypothetical protein